MASQAIQLPPPFKGQNDQLPEFAVQNPFCIRMQNFDNEGGIARLRKGHRRVCQVKGNPLSLIGYGNKLYLMVNDQDAFSYYWYDITTGTPSLVHTVAGFSGADECVTLFFNEYLYWFGEFLFPSQFYNGMAFGSTAYTGATAAFGGAVYKNRSYLVRRLTDSFYYSNIDAISGAVTEVNLGTVVSEQGHLVAIRSVSLSENVTQQTVLAFIFSSGEILVYEGSYPNSASWALAARLKVAPLIYSKSIVDAKGDSFLLTRTEILSLRNLIAKGYSAERAEGIGAAIDNRWRQIMRVTQVGTGLGGEYFYRGLYDIENDRMIISVPSYVHPETEVESRALFQLIYDFTLGAWYEYVCPLEQSGWTGGWVADATYFDKKTFVVDYAINSSSGDQTATVFELDTQTDFLDEDRNGNSVGIPFDLKSAPHPIQRFGVMKTDGLEAIIKSDIYSAIDCKLIGDLGAQETQPQKTSGNGSNISKTFFNIGMEANTIQYRISGTSTTSSVGIELYATNLWVTPSEGLAR